MKRNTTRMLTEGAIFVALAHILDYFKLFDFAWGGSVSLLMIPIVIYALRWGVAQGLLAGFVLSLLQVTIGGGVVISWQSIVLDYIGGFTLLGLGGLFHKNKYGFVLGSLAAGVGRFVAVYISGATIWAVYMPETFFGITMTTPWFYSLLYNGAYILPNTIICIVILALAQKPLGKYLRSEDIS